jgi:hypothetical protein
MDSIRGTLLLRVNKVCLNNRHVCVISTRVYGYSNCGII